MLDYGLASYFCSESCVTMVYSAAVANYYCAEGLAWFSLTFIRPSLIAAASIWITSMSVYDSESVEAFEGTSTLSSSPFNCLSILKVRHCGSNISYVTSAYERFFEPFVVSLREGIIGSFGMGF